MRTAAYRRRRQLARQRRKAAERESWRRWKESGGIMGWLGVVYPEPNRAESMALSLGMRTAQLLERS